MSYGTVFIYRCRAGHAASKDARPGMKPPPGWPCPTCAQSAARAKRFGKPVPPENKLEFAGERRVKLSIRAGLRG